MAYVMIWNPVERFLWGVAITLLLICGLIYTYRGTQREDRNERLILFGYSSLFFGWALHRVVVFLWEIQLEGIYMQNDFYGILDINNINFQIFTFWSLLFAYIGYFLFFFAVEMSLNRTKFLISIIFASNIISYIIFWFILPFELLWNVVVPIIAIFFISFLTILLFLLTKYSRIEFKAISSVIFFGYVLIMQGLLLYDVSIKNLNIVPLSIAPIFYILGTLLMMAPSLVNPKYFSRAAIYWLSVGFFSISFIWLMFALYLIIGLPFNDLLLVLAGNLIGTYFVYKFFKILKHEPELEEKEGLKEFLSSFARTQKVTEEEVSISKEKKVCLVCKGKIGRFNNYICPKCDVLYCENCARTLSDLENICWVCETPFDESKPSKPFKKEKEEVKEIEEVVVEEGVPKKVGADAKRKK